MIDEENLPPANEDSPEDNLRRIADGATGPIGSEDTTRSRLVSQFVVFPVAIILVGLGIYLLLGLLTSCHRYLLRCARLATRRW